MAGVPLLQALSSKFWNCWGDSVGDAEQKHDLATGHSFFCDACSCACMPLSMHTANFQDFQISFSPFFSSHTCRFHWMNHRIIEHPKLEGTHKGHQVQLLKQPVKKFRWSLGKSSQQHQSSIKLPLQFKKTWVWIQMQNTIQIHTIQKYNTKNIYFLNSVEVEGGFSVVKIFKHTSILTPFPHQI